MKFELLFDERYDYMTLRKMRSKKWGAKKAEKVT